MTASSALSLEEAIRQSGAGWLLGWFPTPEAALDHIRKTLQAVDEEARIRLEKNAPELNESVLLAEFSRNPQQVRGFLQALGRTTTPEMLLMAWRIIQGMSVKNVEINYTRERSFEASVVLESPDGVPDPPYKTTRIHDFALFRHVGIIEISGRPVFDGFYPLRVGDT